MSVVDDATNASTAVYLCSLTGYSCIHPVKLTRPDWPESCYCSSVFNHSSHSPSFDTYGSCSSIFGLTSSCNILFHADFCTLILSHAPSHDFLLWLRTYICYLVSCTTLVPSHNHACITLTLFPGCIMNVCALLFRDSFDTFNCFTAATILLQDMSVICEMTYSTVAVCLLAVCIIQWHTLSHIMFCLRI